MTKTQIAKHVTSAIVGWSTSKVVRNVIENNTEPDGTTDKLAVTIGSYVLGAIAADASKKWTDAQIDKLIAWWTDDVMSKFHESE